MWLHDSSESLLDPSESLYDSSESLLESSESLRDSSESLVYSSEPRLGPFGWCPDSFESFGRFASSEGFSCRGSGGRHGTLEPGGLIVTTTVLDTVRRGFVC